MSVTTRLVPPADADRLVRALNRVALALDTLRAQAKFAHWNVRGTLHFAALHALFDDVAEDARELTDVVAERAVQLDGVADTRASAHASPRASAHASPRAHFTPNDTSPHDAVAHVRRLTSQCVVAAQMCNDVARRASAMGDEATNTLLGDAAARLAKRRWMLESSIPTA